jgi:thiol peroxidase
MTFAGGFRKSQNESGMKQENSMPSEERTGVVTAHGTPVTLLGPGLKVGDLAPDFTVVDEAFRPVRLADFKGKTVLISAVPSLDTGVCAIQTKRFNDEAEKLPAGVAVLTISEDLPFAQTRFCGAESIKNIRVLSDSVHRDFGLRYGVLIKETALLARSIWVIGPDGRLRYREIVPELTHHPDYDRALAAVR